MLAVTGLRTTIVQALTQVTGEPVARIHSNMERADSMFTIPAGADGYVLAHGVLHGIRIERMPSRQIEECVNVNLVSTLRLTEQILRTDSLARIVIIGSMSAREGSFDQLYAATKAGVHAYVQTRLVQEPQILCCIAPTIIADSGMTRGRRDYPQVLTRRPSVTAMQVAQAVQKVLFCKAEDSERYRNRMIYLEGEIRCG